ncbi:MAG: hypothetical protein WC976_06890 [Caldisericia bacterium]
MDKKIINKLSEEVRPFGFSLSAYSLTSGGAIFRDNGGLTLEIWVDKNKNIATLSFMEGLFFVEARNFAWPHPKFEKLFLNKARELKKKIKRT